MGEVLGRVIDGGLAEVQPSVDARPEGPIFTELEPVLHLGQTDEHEAQQRAAVPGVVGQDVEVVEDVLVKQVSLVEEEDGVAPLLAELLDMTGDLVKTAAAVALGESPRARQSCR